MIGASAAGHLVILTGITLLLLVAGSRNLPQISERITMRAFVSAPPPPPPPPPAASVLPVRSTAPAPAAPRGPANPAAAPVEAPHAIQPEQMSPAASLGQGGGEERGEGGVEGGIPGGLAGERWIEPTPPSPPPSFPSPSSLPAPPVPPPSSPAPRKPLRIGGAVRQPALLHRVEPEYPRVAVQAEVEGAVILEANVDADGRVTDVKVLKSIKLLDQSAIDAVAQWRYAPLLMDGTAWPWTLTVSLRFSLRH